MQIYRTDQTFSVLIFVGTIYSGKLCVFKVFEYAKIYLNNNGCLMTF